MNFSKHVLYCVISIVYCLLYLPFHGMLFFLLGRSKRTWYITRTPRGRIQQMQNCHLKKICVKEHWKTKYSQRYLHTFSFWLNLGPLWFHFLCKRHNSFVFMYVYEGVLCTWGIAHGWRCMCLCAHGGQQRTLGVLFHHSLPYSIGTGPVTDPGSVLVAMKPHITLGLLLSGCFCWF